MAVTQYIGARYVPLFYTNPNDGTNAWHAGVAYDPLTIVTDLNQSYTSKIPVPASVGRPSENPTYWILTGAYSAQLEEYHQEVVAVQNDLDDLTEDVENIPRKRRYILLGDSYGYGIQGGGRPWATGWLQYCKDTFDTDVYYLNQTSDPVEGIIGFTTSLPFLTVLQQIAQRTPINSPETITDIVVIGGNNDGASASQAAITTAVENFCTYARTTYPNAEIKIGVLGYNARSLYEGNQSFIKYRTAALANGCTFISDLLMVACNPAYYSDGTHVTAAGYDFINPYIAEAVMSGHASYFFEFEAPLTVDTTKLASFTNQALSLRCYITEKGYQAAITRANSYTGWFCNIVSPTTSGTMMIGDALTFTDHTPMLPRQFYALGYVNRIGVMSGGGNGVVAKGTYYMENNSIQINGGFYHAGSLGVVNPSSQVLEFTYPQATQLI